MSTENTETTAPGVEGSTNDTDDTTKGVAGRTNYRQWDEKVASILKEDKETTEREKEESNKELGLNGKYPYSKDDQMEREKSAKLKQSKRILETYRKREEDVVQSFSNIFPTDYDTTKSIIRRLTRQDLQAGKRVITLCDTTGPGKERGNCKIILTQDLTHLQTNLGAATSGAIQPKSFADDADNGVSSSQQSTNTTIFGLIKVFITNVHNCTITIDCKLITGTVEMSNCSNVTLQFQKHATLSTCQLDLCQNVHVSFYNTTSAALTSHQQRGGPKYWGQDVNDRLFLAGVEHSKISVLRDELDDEPLELSFDYREVGAVAVGNASALECQFVVSIVDEALVAERVIRHGSTTGKYARAMTQRELDRAQQDKKTVSKFADDCIKIIDKKTGKPLPIVKKEKETTTTNDDEKNNVVHEVYTSMSKQEIDAIVQDCEQNKERGNKAFGAGQYAQAILLYSLALDKAAELPDAKNDDKNESSPQLVPRHVLYSNRAAAFLKLGEHQKALDDAVEAQKHNTNFIKAIFRQGLALHAMGRFQEAMQVLAKAHNLEPQNKQIRQALQFAEVRFEQDMRKRHEGAAE